MSCSPAICPTRNRPRKPAVVVSITSLPCITIRVPLWVDGALQRATACDPRERYDTLSEFVYDLGHPNSRFESRAPLPLIERNPVRLWQGIAAAMLVWNLLMLYFLTGG